MAGKQFPIGVVIQGKDKSAPAVRGIGKITRKADKAKRSIGSPKASGGSGALSKYLLQALRSARPWAS